MAITNFERVGKALELLRSGLAPYVEREFTGVFAKKAREEAERYLVSDRLTQGKSFIELDASALLKLMWDSWNEIFRKTLGFAERSLISEIRDYRNKWAHQQTFSGDDADRALDSIARLLSAVSASEADEVLKMKMELRRQIFEEQARHDRRKQSSGTVESAATSGLKPWREVVTPHKDVATGRYQQAEFAADLWQVHKGEGTAEYRDPIEFFRRTFLTESLKQLLEGAIQRILGKGGDPVVQLQTNFGGGKTHSMLALYHLFGGAKAGDLLGVEELMKGMKVDLLPEARRVVLVGNKISPGNPIVKGDGTVINTLWGELAWQLGGREAYDRIRADDERATNPGDVIRELMNDYGPSLILIDEWVAYARQLHDQGDLPGGNFETHFTFAQSLTESAKNAKRCLLVVSLPASESGGGSSSKADDVEVGGERGRAALDRLRNAVGRVEASWRPATAQEGFEIVRRRLFEPIVEKEQFVARDNISRAFYDLYRTQKQEFPSECGEIEYERRLKAAYPIHPEVFDRLYSDWSTLIKFQRTRGVLRLMASVIHSLWEKGDRNPLIMPGNLPIDDQRVKYELTRYLTDNWDAVISKDVDGPDSLPVKIDNEQSSTLGRFSACKRVARTIYLGSAPIDSAANKGIEDRRIKLGCVMPGESPGTFGDALRRLANGATYLYPDGNRYWYSLQPTVTKLAEDRAAELKRGKDKIIQELERRIREDLREKGDFRRVHPCPQSGADVADDMEASLVVLSPECAFSKGGQSLAESTAKAIWESRGNSPRIYRNTIVFLAPDASRLGDLEEACARLLAWESILDEKNQLELAPSQVKQAETQRDAANKAILVRLPETYQWILSPKQDAADLPVIWESLKMNGQDSLAVRVSKKLKSEDLLYPVLSGTNLRHWLDKVPLWRGNHVELRQLAEDFARYTYLPRVSDSSVIVRSVEDSLCLMTWVEDTFAFADSFDEAAQRYRGLKAGNISGSRVGNDPIGLVVKALVAKAQIDADQQKTATSISGEGAVVIPGVTVSGTGVIGSPTVVKPKSPKRYFGTVSLDSTRVGRDAGRIADEVISHLVALVGSNVKVTLEIEAEISSGVPDNVVRTVTENSRTLKFENHGFEDE